MKQKIINMLKGDESVATFADTRLSFKPFIDNLKKRLLDEDSVKKEFIEFVLQKFESYPDILSDKKLENISKYKELLDLLYVALTNLSEDEKFICWGLCVPMSPIVFYGSDPFYELLINANKLDSEAGLQNENLAKCIYENFYSFILKKFYGIRFQQKIRLIRNMKDESCGIIRRFEIHLNTDFVDVSANGPLPEIDSKMIRKYGMEEDSFHAMKENFTIGNFSFSGFTIITVSDITAEYALDAIRSSLEKDQAGEINNDFSEIVQSLKELAGCSEIEFNVIPLFKINDKLADDEDVFKRSILFSRGWQNNFSDRSCLEVIKKFSTTPSLLYYYDLEIDKPKQPELASILMDEDIKSYALFPVIYNKKLVGAFEIYSRVKGLLDEKKLSLLEPVKDPLAQLLHIRNAAKEVEIDRIIKEKYTRLQPSVQWKFKEAAWSQIKNNKRISLSGQPVMNEVGFKNVFPLYGAVDIRNSTLERNKATMEDFSDLFKILLKVLHSLKDKTGLELLDEKIFRAAKWEAIVQSKDPNFNQEVKLKDFLENEIEPFLLAFTKDQSELNTIAQEYFIANDIDTGAAHKNRRQMETSMYKVISLINNYCDKLKDEMEAVYPCYFEKFRTDGVEYDIYIGQSVSPNRPFNEIYLKNLRLMQLSSMASIAKYTNELLPQLDNDIETTQLIFVHSQPIDILFRNDEKRFDVEGAYNIRYQIVKKRIDKVHLMNSDERLTQPGKIALVYFSEKESYEYISYIKYLQADNILNNDLEKLELEDLSGVSGLKALRVGVNFNRSEK
jgi:hypothetical protein